MKRFGLVLLAVVVLAGCGGDDDFDFNGSWTFTRTVTSSSANNKPGYPVGMVIENKYNIVQDGIDIRLMVYGSGVTYVGTADTGSKVFSAEYVSGFWKYQYTGTADGNTMSGTWIVYHSLNPNGNFVRANFTATR